MRPPQGPKASADAKLRPGTSSTRKYFVPNFSPAGLHVLVVDDDPLCLVVLERMLKQCNYKVTTCLQVHRALELLRENKNNFDIVMTDVYMPNEDGFKLLEVIGIELDLPVIMMSANSDMSVVMRGITHGACDYLIKPVRIEELKNIWQHVLRRKGRDFQQRAAAMEEDMESGERSGESVDQFTKKRKENKAMADMVDSNSDDPNLLKKARVTWSVQLHKLFVNAVNQLGLEKAVPKRILEIMNVQGLTRENVASHLQKYRLYLKRLSGVVPGPQPIASFQALGDGILGGSMVVQSGGKGAIVSGSGMKGLNLGAGLGAGAARQHEIDPGTMVSLSQFKSHQQKRAANRAQVLNALGVADQRSPSSSGLPRMMSLDLSCFLQEQHVESKPTGLTKREVKKAYDDLMTYNLGQDQLQRQQAEGPATLEWIVPPPGPPFPLSGGVGQCHPNRMDVVPEDGVDDEDPDCYDDNDTVSSTASILHEQPSTGSTQEQVSSNAQEQVSYSTTSSEMCSALDNPLILGTYIESTDLDIADYLQLDEGEVTVHRH